MKLLLALIFLMPLSLWANWNADITLAVDGETSKLASQVFIEGKQTSMSVGDYIVNLTLKQRKAEKNLDVTYTVTEKTKKTLVNKGWDIIGDTGSNDIYAKGEPNQPNSIITLNFKTK